MQKEKPFHTLDKAENLMNDVIMVTSHAPKKFRPNYVHMLQESAMAIFDDILFGNEYRYDEEMRKKYQKQAGIHMKRLTRLLERAQRVQCITMAEEADLGRQLAILQGMFEGWAGSKNI